MREALDAEHRRGAGQTLGWYARRPEIGTRMLPADEQLYADLFPQPWQFALVLAPAAGEGPEDRTTGAVFIYSGKAVRSCQVPFHECVEIRSKRGERKRTVLQWPNYVPSEPVVRASAAEEAALREAARGSKPGPFGQMLSRVRQWIGTHQSGR